MKKDGSIKDLNHKLAEILKGQPNVKKNLIASLKKEALRGGPGRTTDKYVTTLYLSEDGRYTPDSKYAIDEQGVEVVISYDYSPEVAETRMDPGAPAEIDILGVVRAADGSPIDNCDEHEIKNFLEDEMIVSTVDRYYGEQEDHYDGLREEGRLAKSTTNMTSDQKLASVLDRRLKKTAALSREDFSTLQKVVQERNPHEDEMGIENLVNGILKENPTTLAEALAKMDNFYYHINLDERGEFYADVRKQDGETVFEIKGFDIFQDGFMKHKDDLVGLEKYLIELGIMKHGNDLRKGN